MIQADQVRRQLDRIVASSGFTNSERLRRFLCYVVRAVLEGRASEVKEYTLGVEVFDRGPDYDPRLEPIVRVEARRLRSKLAKYYEADGRQDPILITLPTGSYTPQWEARTAASAAPPRHSAAPVIAVLPFSDSAGDYLANGLAEELIRALTRASGLRVVAWPPAVETVPRDARRIGEQVGASYVLDGRMWTSGERIRVTAQLLETTTGFYMWSEIYDRESPDAFSLFENLARAICAALETRLGPVPSAAGPLPRPRNPEAYNAYLKGRFHWNKRSTEGLNRAVVHFEQALAADPQFAPAHAGLADAYSILGQSGQVSPLEYMPKAKAAAARALEIDPGSAEAHASLGVIAAAYDYDWETSAEYLRKAIACNPNYATAHHWYAYDYLTPVGRMEEAAEEILLALQLDPLSPAIGVAAGTIFAWSRQYDRAIEIFHNTLELDASAYRIHLNLGRTYIEQGRLDEGLAVLENIPGPGRSYPATLATKGHALAACGRTAEALELLGELERRARTDYVSPFLFARLYCGFPDREKALNWLERGYGDRDSHLIHARVAPLFDPLRGEARFRRLLEKIRLPK